MRTLVVDDDFTSRLFLQSILSEYGECHSAMNGKESVAAFRVAQDCGQNYNLVCMDITMPEMDGPTAVREIRALEEAEGTMSTNGVKIIMTTAIDDVKDVMDSFESLCDVYLVKPINKAKLIEKLRDLGLI
jgi:two-component system chemotaxis response regulator CheY